jgi:acetoin:2,6-dichlorophenolindophenol oxidoreductase subunit alpha
MTDVHAPAAADQATLLALYRQMTLIRGFEDRVQSLFLKGHVYGTTHLCSGQEATEVGVASMLRPGDRVGGTYRGHGHALALGLEPQKLMDELLGRATGVCGGRAGSMNVIDPEHGLLGCYGIVGGSIAAATGAALSAKRQGRVAAAFFGDGATNQGYFHECLNFAKVFELPVVFVCENNVYSEYSRTTDLSRGDIQSRATALGVPARQVDGMSIWLVRDAAGQTVAAARSGKGPRFLEALTYRFVGHSRSDPARYRPEGELEAWRGRDPLTLCRERLASEGLDDAELETIEAAINAEVDAAVQDGLAAPWPDPSNLPSEFKE